MFGMETLLRTIVNLWILSCTCCSVVVVAIDPRLKLPPIQLLLDTIFIATGEENYASVDVQEQTSKPDLDIPPNNSANMCGSSSISLHCMKEEKQVAEDVMYSNRETLISQ